MCLLLKQLLLTSFLSFSLISCNDNLRVAFEWKQLDFEFSSEDARQKAIANREFVQENNVPLGLEVFGDRLFITVPRWKSGIPASLTYIKLTDPTDSPKLHPYPNWEAHKLSESPGNDPPEIVSPFRIRADQCGRLWVLDTGIVDLLSEPRILGPSQLLVYNLHNDTLLRKYPIPNDQITGDSFFTNIAVEDENCDDTYAYLGDSGDASVIVYSWRDKSSWRVKHHYFHVDPLAGEFNVANISFEVTDAVFGLALSGPDSDGNSTLYFHPLTGTNEFAVSTRLLHNATLAKQSFHEFRVLGSRGPKGQSSVSFLDKKSGVLFYALVNLNAVACWRTTNPSYTMESQGRIYMSNVTMVFPNDIKVDAEHNLWVLSDRFPIFMYSRLNESDVNFRILTAPVNDAIRNTSCDSKLIVSPGMSNKFKTSIISTTVSTDTRAGDGDVPGNATQILLNSFVILFSLLVSFSVYEHKYFI